MGRGLIVVGHGLDAPAGPSWAPRGPALAPVVNRPVIGHAVETLRDAGAEEIVVVADRAAARVLREALGADHAGRENVRWIELAAPPSDGEGILAAAPILGGDRFLLHRADGLLLRGSAPLRRALAETSSDATVFFRARRETEVPAPLPAVLAGRGAAAAAAQGEPEALEPGGVHAFGPAIFDALRAEGAEAIPGGGDRLMAAVERLAEQDEGAVRAAVVDGWWSYTGVAQDLLDANREALDILDGSPVALAGTRIEGRVQVDPTAEVSGSLLRGPVLVGPGARITGSYLGPYTSVGERAVIEGSEVESSIVLAGATLRDLRSRLEGSIVGARATISREPRLPRSLRVLVGEGAEVTVS